MLPVADSLIESLVIFKFITNKSGRDQNFVLYTKQKQSLPKTSDNSKIDSMLLLFKFCMTSKKHQFVDSFEKFQFLPKVFFYRVKITSFYFVCLEKGYIKPTKRRKNTWKKTLKTWKNHGKVMEKSWNFVCQLQWEPCTGSQSSHNCKCVCVCGLGGGTSQAKCPPPPWRMTASVRLSGLGCPPSPRPATAGRRQTTGIIPLVGNLRTVKIVGFLSLASC